MKIGFISQWYDPETGSAAIPGSIVRALEARGNVVEVVTGFPNYPTGRLYPGHRMRLLKRDTVGATRVNRVAMFPSHDDSGAKRALTYLAFMVSASTLGAFLLRKVDVVLVYSTSATVGMSGVLGKWLFGRKYVLYIEDLWPDSVMASGMVPARVARPATWFINRLCSLGYRNASRIAVISPGMKDILVTRGVASDKIDVVYNWVDESIFRPVAAPRRADSGFELMYAGSLGDVQGLEVAVEAMSLVPAEHGVRLRLIGSGLAEESLKTRVADLGLHERVSFEGSHPLEAMPHLMASADAQLVCLRDIPLFHATMPSKTQAILASGLPAVVSAPGDVAALVARAQAGVVARAGDASALAEAITTMSGMTHGERTQLGLQGRSFYERELCAAVGSRRLEESLKPAQLEGTA